jgi:hypothetical protein
MLSVPEANLRETLAFTRYSRSPLSIAQADITPPYNVNLPGTVCPLVRRRKKEATVQLLQPAGPSSRVCSSPSGLGFSIYTFQTLQAIAALSVDAKSSGHPRLTPNLVKQPVCNRCSEATNGSGKQGRYDYPVKGCHCLFLGTLRTYVGTRIQHSYLPFSLSYYGKLSSPIVRLRSRDFRWGIDTLLCGYNYVALRYKNSVTSRHFDFAKTGLAEKGL